MRNGLVALSCGQRIEEITEKGTKRHEIRFLSISGRWRIPFREIRDVIVQ